MLFRYTNDKNGNPIKKAVIYTKNEHSISNNSIDSDALFVINKLKEQGFEAYIVGGAVRDLLLGHEPKDFDLVTNATPQRLKKIFRNSRIIGKRFRLVHIFFGKKIFEVSTFRSMCDGCSIGNDFGNMDEDVMRRDFTFNALYYDPAKKQLIDYVDGVKDIEKKRIKPVIPLDKIFVEDPVRMIRAVKYAALTDFSLPHNLKRQIKRSCHLLSPISPSRLTEEFFKILNSGHSYEIVSLALETSLYMYLQPQASALISESKDFEQSYLNRLKTLDAKIAIDNETRQGEKLIAIIQDFVEGLTDWEKEAEDVNQTEIYGKTWTRVRHFVLPINPQRVELDYAIKKILKSYGIKVKKPKREKQVFAKPEKEPSFVKTKDSKRRSTKAKKEKAVTKKVGA